MPYSEDELRALGEVFKRYPNTFIISDEIYEHIRFEGEHFSLAKVPELFDRVIVVNGVSKSFAMTGWRIGYIAANLTIAKACTRNAKGNSPAAHLPSAKWRPRRPMHTDPAELKAMVQAFAQRREIMIDGLSKIPGFVCNRPEGAFYLFPKVSELFGKQFNGSVIANATDLCMYLINVAHVASRSWIGVWCGRIHSIELRRQ